MVEKADFRKFCDLELRGESQRTGNIPCLTFGRGVYDAGEGLERVSGAAGYQVKVSTSKKFAKKTTVTVNAKSVKVTVKKLKANKTYYVKARAYKKVSGSKVYGKWSKVIKIANK